MRGRRGKSAHRGRARLTDLGAGPEGRKGEGREGGREGREGREGRGEGAVRRRPRGKAWAKLTDLGVGPEKGRGVGARPEVDVGNNAGMK